MFTALQCFHKYYYLLLSPNFNKINNFLDSIVSKDEIEKSRNKFLLQYSQRFQRTSG